MCRTCSLVATPTRTVLRDTLNPEKSAIGPSGVSTTTWRGRGESALPAAAFRDDLGTGWFADASGDSVDGSGGTDADANAFDRTFDECAKGAATLLEADGTSFVNGALSIESGATLYQSFDEAAQDMRFLDDRANRDCLRSAFLAGFAEGADDPADFPPIDIQIERLSIPGLPTDPMRPARAWLITVVADVEGPMVLVEMLIMGVQIGEVVVNVGSSASYVEATEPSDAAMDEVFDAFKQVAQRAQTWTPA
jgi:hypothetical protein